MALPQLSDLDFNSVSRILNLPDAVSAQQPATLAQVNAIAEGISWKDNCRLASTVNLTIATPGALIDGSVPAANDRVLLKNQTVASGNGIYIYNGAATPLTRASDANTFDELESAVVTIDEGTANAGTTWRQTAVNGVIDLASVTWASFGTTTPAASETMAGIAELATQAEVDTGTDDLRIVTPLKLANAASTRKLFEATIGDGAATSYTVNHNLNSRGVAVTVYRASGNFDTVFVEIQRTSVNAVTIVFSAAPALNSFNVLVTR